MPGRRLDLNFGAGSRLRQVEAFCRLRRAGGTEDVLGSGWSRRDGRWVATCGPVEISLESREGAGAVELRLRAQAREAAVVEAIGLRGEALVGDSVPQKLIQNGYQSWDECEIWQPGERPAKRSSWWTCGLTGANGTLALSARSARRHATRFDWDGSVLSILQVAASGPDGSLPVWRARRGSNFEAEAIVATAGGDVSEVLEKAAGRLARRSPSPPHGWLSWYEHGAWVTREEVTASAGLMWDGNVVQIDDGWQMAYGDWTPNTKFQPLSDLTAELRAAGKVPGIWTAPFLVSLAADLRDSAPPDWFLADPSTHAPVIDPRHLVFGPMNVLDARRPEVRDHLEQVFRKLREDGFAYFKIDFLYAGAYAGLPALRAGIRAIRRGIGPDAYLLACGAPLLAVAGLADGCRIGPDTCTPFYDFEAGRSKATFFGDEVQAVARDLALRRHLHGWFQLDPDVALAPEALEPGRARQLITTVALAGGLFFMSDSLPNLTQERRDLLANPEIAALPAGGPARPDLDTASGRTPPVCWCRDDGLLAFFNWGREPAVHELSGAPQPVRDLWARADLTPAGSIEVPPQDVRVLRLGGGRL